ncbi:hypothetical protein P9112_004533 [Eukaryota sp. TZLM1-RC]
MSVPPFGIVISGRPIATNIQQISPDRFVYEFENAFAAKNVAVFLTGSVELPPGLAASIYVSSAPFQDWRLLGALTCERPSAIFPLEWNQASVSQADFEVKAQIGIFIGAQDQITSELVNKTMFEVQARPIVNLTTDQIGQKMLKDFSNYVSSFAKEGPNGQLFVETSVVDKWVANFERRCRFNPKFWTMD